MLTKIMWNIVIEKKQKQQERKDKNFSYCCIHAQRVHCVYSNLLIAVEVGVFCLFLDKTIIIVEVEAGKQRPYFIKSLGKENGVYVRVAGTTRPADSYMIK